MCLLRSLGVGVSPSRLRRFELAGPNVELGGAGNRLNLDLNESIFGNILAAIQFAELGYSFFC
jgi:hypothetical protein